MPKPYKFAWFFFPSLLSSFKDTIDNTKEFQYVYSWKINKTKALRVSTKVDSTIDPLPKTEYPLRISVRYDKGSTNWHIPFR